MIPRSKLKWQEINTWKQEIANLLSDPKELAEILRFDEHQQAELEQACAGFALRIPRPYLSRIQVGNLNDPLLLQVLPQAQENETHAGYVTDPLEEKQFTPVDGLLHKYESRVLIVMNSVCAIHCRYCFRRHFPYQEHRIDKHQWQKILDYIASQPKVDEVIFSGGDPFSTSDGKLAEMIEQLAEIPHLKRIRIHSRLCIVIPQRITDALLKALTSTRLKCVLVVHVNHAQEIDNEVKQALQACMNAGIRLLNQSVLLAKINDDVNSLCELSHALFDCGVLPYYLHMLDKVTGTHHFDVSLDRAKQLQKQLEAALPGYLVPKFVYEAPEQPNKLSI